MGKKKNIRAFFEKERNLEVRMEKREGIAPKYPIIEGGPKDSMVKKMVGDYEKKFLKGGQNDLPLKKNPLLQKTKSNELKIRSPKSMKKCGSPKNKKLSSRKCENIVMDLQSKANLSPAQKSALNRRKKIFSDQRDIRDFLYGPEVSKNEGAQ